MVIEKYLMPSDQLMNVFNSLSLKAVIWWGWHVVNHTELFHPYWTLYAPPSELVYKGSYRFSSRHLIDSGQANG